MNKEEGIRSSIFDYLQLTKPKIIPLLLLVAVASAFIAKKSIPSLYTLAALVIAGTLVSAGSLALNSYLEMDIDAKMRRTRRRPLPSKRIVPPGKALIFALSLLSLGVIISYLTLNVISATFIALGAVIYVPVYTMYLKPRTVWNIVLGGFAGSCASLAGWYAVPNNDWIVGWALAALVFIWTPSHFWSLAVITEEDYSSVSIPMLPSVVGPAKAARAIVANTLILIPVSLIIYPYMTGIGAFLYLAGSSLFNFLLLVTNIKLLASPTKDNAWFAFKFSSPYLAVIFVLSVVGALL
ncbi:MAG: heme o synthase [Conexivisphaerales archaeon]